jgi:formamidopyrimidine-DNA glycosylase
MPELPEVETTRRGLEPRIRGRRILRVELSLPKLLKAAPAGGLKSAEGRRILGLRRRAKHLWMDLEGGLTLCIHLGMSGQLTWWDPALPDSPGFLRHRHTGLQKTAGQHAPDAHTHLLLHLQGGGRVQYRDPRQFGALRLLPTAGLERTPPFAGLGPEPLEPGFTAQGLAERLKARRSPLKALLLDQAVLAGVGNIYADEALHASGLHPLRRGSSLRPEEASALWQSLRRALRQGIRLGGSSISDYVNAEGRRGGNQEQLKAYGRAGLPCLRCGTRLKRIQVVQRSTVFCPRCQRSSGGSSRKA